MSACLHTSLILHFQIMAEHTLNLWSLVFVDVGSWCIKWGTHFLIISPSSRNPPPFSPPVVTVFAQSRAWRSPCEVESLGTTGVWLSRQPLNSRCRPPLYLDLLPSAPALVFLSLSLTFTLHQTQDSPECVAILISLSFPHPPPYRRCWERKGSG